ncbi:MAG: rplW [Candidatus Saccharibacteria bacterium]|nr:rplW [Candidatus Saccharibacteria bacterium]
MLLTVTPRRTEKAFGLSQSNTYVFDVPVGVNKQEIVQAIESQYGVSIKSITTLVQNGKAIRFSRGKNRYPGTTTRKNSKKAYVVLAEGSTLDIFDAPVAEEETK